MFPKCISGPVDATQKVVDDFASEGLRTLVFGHKIISEEEYEAFKASLAAAKQNLSDREELVRQAYGELENKLHLVRNSTKLTLASLQTDASGCTRAPVADFLTNCGLVVTRA